MSCIIGEGRVRLATVAFERAGVVGILAGPSASPNSTVFMLNACLRKGIGYTYSGLFVFAADGIPTLGVGKFVEAHGILENGRALVFTASLLHGLKTSSIYLNTFLVSVCLRQSEDRGQQCRKQDDR